MMNSPVNCVQSISSRIITMFLGGIFFLGCTNPQPEAPALLAQAEQWMDVRPDRALLLIDSIFYPERSLNKEQYMHYLVARTQARYKNYLDVSGDTILFPTQAYFSRRGDDRQAALAYFYGGCVYRDAKDLDKAMLQYKKAEEFATMTGEVDLQGLILYNQGELLAEQGQYGEALGKYRQAESCYSQSPGNPDEKQASCLSAAGRMWLLKGEQDSAFATFHQGVELAEAAGDRELQSLLTQNLSVNYREAEEYDQAELYLRISFDLNSYEDERPRYWLNFAKLFTLSGQIDSAVVYTDKLKEAVGTSGDPYFKASAYNYLAEWEGERGNYQKAINYQNKRIRELTNIMETRKEQSVYDVQQKYNFEYFQNIYNTERIHYLRLIILMLVILIVGGVSVTMYVQGKKKQWINVQREIDALTRINVQEQESINQTNSVLRSILSKQLFIAINLLKLYKTYRKASCPEKYLILQMANVLYGKTDLDKHWEVVKVIFNEIYPGLETVFQRRFPDLDPIEIQICMLDYGGLKIMDMGFVLDYKSNTIQSFRTRIRKKIDAAPGEKIAVFIEKELIQLDFE